MKELKENLKKWKGTLFLSVGRLSIIKMSILSNLMYRFNTIPTNSLSSYFGDIYKVILKFTWKRGRHRTINTILKNKIGGLTVPYVKTHYKVTVFKTAWYQQKIDI